MSEPTNIKNIVPTSARTKKYEILEIKSNLKILKPGISNPWAISRGRRLSAPSFDSICPGSCLWFDQFDKDRLCDLYNINRSGFFWPLKTQNVEKTPADQKSVAALLPNKTTLLLEQIISFSVCRVSPAPVVASLPRLICVGSVQKKRLPPVSWLLVF